MSEPIATVMFPALKRVKLASSKTMDITKHICLLLEVL
jgi:hypothetical protein